MFVIRKDSCCQKYAKVENMLKMLPKLWIGDYLFCLPNEGLHL